MKKILIIFITGITCSLAADDAPGTYMSKCFGCEYNEAANRLTCLCRDRAGNVVETSAQGCNEYMSCDGRLMCKGTMCPECENQCD